MWLLFQRDNTQKSAFVISNDDMRHLFRVMRRHDMTKKIDKDKYKDKDKDNDKDKDILRTPPKSNPRDL